MEIEAATLEQVRKGRDGKFVLIENDVQNIATDLKKINGNFRLRYSELGHYFVVYYKNPVNGDEELVTTAQELDKRLVKRVQIIAAREYNYADEIEKLDRAAKEEAEKRVQQHIFEHGERLAHSLRKDLGYNKDSARSKKSWGKK